MTTAQQTLCANCGKPLSPYWTQRCEHCGAPLQVTYGTAAPGPQYVPPPGMVLVPAAARAGHPVRNFLAIVGVLVVSLVVAAAVGRLSPAASSSAGGAGDTSWVPAGYTSWSDKIVFHWIDSPTCTYSAGKCWAMYVVPKNGCPTTLFVELSLSDASGTAVGYTNGALAGIAPGQKAMLTFDTFAATAQKAKITAITCL